MSTALILALIATVVLLGTMTYFLMGSAGLLVLKHQSPVDSLVVRGFFNTYYWVALAVSAATAVVFAFTRYSGLSAGAVVLAVAAFVLRLLVVPRMDALHARLQAGDRSAIAPFRRWHVAAIGMNLALLVATVATLIASRVDLT